MIHVGLWKWPNLQEMRKRSRKIACRSRKHVLLVKEFTELECSHDLQASCSFMALKCLSATPEMKTRRKGVGELARMVRLLLRCGSQCPSIGTLFSFSLNHSCLTHESPIGFAFIILRTLSITCGSPLD